MALTDKKITDSQMTANGVVSAPDRLTGTAAQNKAVFDKLIRAVVSEALNGVIDEIVGSTGSAQIGTPSGTVEDRLTALLNSITGHTGRSDNPHGTTKAQVGLGNVDNTADLNKPISIAVQAALNALGAQTATAYSLAQSVSGTADDARQKATEAKTIAVNADKKVDGVYFMIDPVQGGLKPLQEIFNNIFNATKTSPITAAEYAALGITADQYAAKHLTALEYNTRGKQLLGGI